MPYIKTEDREKLCDLTNHMEETRIESAGELNYLLTILVHSFLTQRAESYQSYNDALGSIEGCKLELYRRAIGNYEDLKIDLNGDVP